MKQYYTITALVLLLLAIFVPIIYAPLLGAAAVCVLISGLSQQLSRYAEEWRATRK